MVVTKVLQFCDPGTAKLPKTFKEEVKGLYCKPIQKTVAQQIFSSLAKAHEQYVLEPDALKI